MWVAVRVSEADRGIKRRRAFKYSPNLHARSLAGGQSRSIGVIVSNIDNPFFLDVYRAVETRAHDAGYEVISPASSSRK
jgi:DNA-binding LacI/PurR family transcriptional regulator